MINTRKKTGERGEEVAAEYLRERGYEVLERNWNCREGELDIVARKDGGLVFVEVKTRRTERYGRGEEAIGAGKMRKIIMAVEKYLEERGCAEDTVWGVDAVVVEADERGVLQVNLHVENVEIE